jgi:hypothetical protein
LREEKNNGTSILRIKGFNMIGEPLKEDLSDINLHEIIKYNEYDGESKQLCFLRDKIKEMNYSVGAHYSTPFGQIKYSDNTYKNKHMSTLELPFYKNKIINRYERSKLMRANMLATHYTDNINIITNYYNKELANSNT